MIKTFLFCSLIGLTLCRTTYKLNQLTSLNLDDPTTLLIINGTFAKIEDYPWQVSINISINGEESRCGGTILSKNLVLTAAHCLVDDYGKKAKKVLVFAGSNNIQDFKLGLKPFIEVKKFSIPENFVLKIRNDSILEYDIAVLELKHALKLNDVTIKPVCLLNERGNYKRFRNLVATGWGAFKLTNEESCEPIIETSNFLRKSENLRDTSNLSDSKFFHQIATKSQHNACKGDSGGPLISKIKNRMYVVGITSFGDCCMGFSAFTRISFYLDWLKQHIDNFEDEVCVLER